MPNLGAVRREFFLTVDNPLNPPGVGWVNLFKVRVSIRTCVPNLGAVRRSPHTSHKHHATNPQTHKQTSHIPQTSIDNPLNPSGVGWVNFLGESQSRLYPHMRAKFGRGPTTVSKKVSFKFISRFFGRNDLWVLLRSDCNIRGELKHHISRGRLNMNQIKH